MLNEMGRRAKSTHLPLYADAVHRVVFFGCRPSYYLPLYADAVHPTIPDYGLVCHLRDLIFPVRAARAPRPRAGAFHAAVESLGPYQGGRACRLPEHPQELAGYAREVFGSQPDRRFVPGFTICGSVMRLWVFDRSGPYSSEKFDIHKEPERFVRVITGYALMTDAELGLNTFIRRDGNKYIVAQGLGICLEDKPLAWQRAIVCRGTACYRGRNKDPGGWEHVVKIEDLLGGQAARLAKGDRLCREGDLFKLAKERGVKGIAEWVHHEQINIDGHPDTISYLRRGMKVGIPRKLSSKASWVDSGVGSSRALSRTRSLRGRSRSSKGRLKRKRDGLVDGSGGGSPGGFSTSSTTISSSGQKRKRDGLVDGSGGMKRSKSGDSRTDEEIATDAENGDPDTSSLHSIQEPEPVSLAGCESETYGNRIHCCLVVSPAARPLHAYRSTKELLEALRDAVRGHKSLLEDGKILHRDISEK
ncbi:hypothetical protein V490_00025 [Pseudogymnoascus sp. VKM F-3557]|nr:hypothetical protein V490_00025 [Pseudogymnoascus sp. VKM F-3557]